MDNREKIDFITKWISDYILKILSPSMDEYDKFQQILINETGCINMQTNFSQKEIKKQNYVSLEHII